MKNEITKLPDGSAFFTTEVMSKEEAMALPLKERPICFRISSKMYHAIFEAVGAASMCRKPRPGAEVFSSEEASKVAVDLCFKIANEVEELREDCEELTQQHDALIRYWDKDEPGNPYGRHSEWEWLEDLLAERDRLQRALASAPQLVFDMLARGDTAERIKNHFRLSAQQALQKKP